MSTLIIAVFLGLLGGSVILVATLLLLGPLRRPALAAIERARLGRCIARRGRGDARLAANDIDGALREFAASFCFIVPRADVALPAEIQRLHTGLLGRFVSIGDDLPGHRLELLALAKLERLLDQWKELQRRAVRGTGSHDAAELRQHRHLTEHAVQDLINELLTRRRPTLLH